MAESNVTINLALTSGVYRRSDSSSKWPQIVVKTTLKSPESACVELRGEFDSGTILESSFRLEHFEFFDLKTSQPIVKTPFEGTCEPRVFLEPRHVVELKQSQPLETRQQLEDVNPLADPVRMLKADHQYRITLKEQKVWWIGKSKAELFGESSLIPINDLPDGPFMALASSDELILKVEE